MFSKSHGLVSQVAQGILWGVLWGALAVLRADEFDSLQVDNDGSVNGGLSVSGHSTSNGAEWHGGLSVDSLWINGQAFILPSVSNGTDASYDSLFGNWASFGGDLWLGGALNLGGWGNGNGTFAGAILGFQDDGAGKSRIIFTGNSPLVGWLWRQNGASGTADQMVLDEKATLTLTNQATGNTLEISPRHLAVILKNFSTGTSLILPSVGGLAMLYDLGAATGGNGVFSDGSQGSIAMGYSDAVNGNGGIALGNLTAVSGGFGGVAIGNGAGATGYGVIAIGSNVTASLNHQAGLGALALGQNIISSGNGAIALGAGSSVAGDGGIAIGYANSSNNSATILGWANNANGAGAVGIGYNNQATGGGALALGRVNTSAGNGALALGKANTVSGDNSMAAGGNNNVTGSGTVALGGNLTVNADHAFVAGQWNVNVSGSGGTAPIFELGSGSGSNNRSNAFMVFQSGQVAIQSMNYSAPGSSPPGLTQSVALVVNGTTILNGPTTLIQRQGDVYMGYYTNIPADKGPSQ